MHVSVDILENMDSADHFEKEVPSTMTELAEVLQGASDTIF
jgi:Mor family transcriptional regulator